MPHHPSPLLPQVRVTAVIFSTVSAFAPTGPTGSCATGENPLDTPWKSASGKERRMMERILETLQFLGQVRHMRANAILTHDTVVLDSTSLSGRKMGYEKGPARDVHATHL
jgi:hypothetical protein